MKKVLGILDAQEVYIKYFVQYLKEEKRIGFEVQAFTKAENLNRFLEENEMEILLLPFIESRGIRERDIEGKSQKSIFIGRGKRRKIRRISYNLSISANEEFTAGYIFLL